MVNYDVFVHPGFPAEERNVRQSAVFRKYFDRLTALARSATMVIHVIDPKVGHHDAFLEEIIAADRKVRSYVFNPPLLSSSSYGTVCLEDWEKYVGLLRGIRQHRDSVRVHGSYHGVCALDFAVQLYELVYNHKQYFSDPLSCFLEAPFPFCEEDTLEIAHHALQAHYLNSSIRFGTVFQDRSFRDMYAVRKSIVRQMTDQGTKVYSL